MTDELVPHTQVQIAVDADALPAPLRDALVPANQAPPVPQQTASHTNAAKLTSEKVVVSAPLSYAGSAARIWKLTGITSNAAGRVALGLGAIVLILGAWCFVTAWYITFGLLLVPYRLIRRGSRKRKREALQHRELLSAMNRSDGQDS
ncbi:MAG TPA: hypothetical protein VGO71_13755 [Baekduia sp.]|jgi:hypothetical protein|nr:hypothetical protein [Baekduia sp.]